MNIRDGRKVSFQVGRSCVRHLVSELRGARVPRRPRRPPLPPASRTQSPLYFSVLGGV